MKKKIYVVSGGTFEYIRPHLALAAPAFGKVGLSIFERLKNLTIGSHEVEIVHIQTKMANSDSDIITSEDLGDRLDAITDDKDTVAIILSSAICDFTPGLIDGKKSIGKLCSRLSSLNPINLFMTPAPKLIKSIKEKRPDILLVSFKTTSNRSEEYLIDKCNKSMEDNKSDMVFGNDIGNKINVLISKYSPPINYARENIIIVLCDILSRELG